MPRWCRHHASTSARTTRSAWRKARTLTGAKPSQAKRRQNDLDATHTKKHGKSHFGYKLSVSVDIKHGFIRCIATGTASEHDGHHFDEVPDEHKTGLGQIMISRGSYLRTESVRDRYSL